MQNTGQGSEKKSHRVMLLLVVGLAAFSSAMKELNQVQDLTLQTSNLIAQLKDAIAPAGELTTVSVDTCQNTRTSLPPAPPLPALPSLPALAPLPPAAPVESNASDVVVPEPAPASPAPPASPKVREVPRPKRIAPPAHDPAEVRVMLSSDEFVEKSIKDAMESDQSLKALKAKNRRFIFLTPDGRDVILKTLNRSINLRSAS
jgi:hypothetical protein